MIGIATVFPIAALSTVLAQQPKPPSGGQKPGHNVTTNVQPTISEPQKCRTENLELPIGRNHLMPDVTGCIFEMAQAVLKKHDHPPKREPDQLPYVQGQRIVQQDPPVGTTFRSDTKVVLYVSTVPPPVPLPPSEASADVSVKMSLETKGPFVAGQTVEYTIMVSNAGPSAATNVRIVDTAANLIFDVSGACSELQSCTISMIEPGGQAIIKATGTIIAAGKFNNTVTVEAAENDPNRQNNTTKENTGGEARKAKTEENNTVANADPAVNATDNNRDPKPNISWWIVLVAGVGGLVAVGAVSSMIWRFMRPMPSVSKPPVPTPEVLDPIPNPPTPPVPTVKTSVILEQGESAIGELQMTAPPLRMNLSIESGETFFGGTIPILRTEVIHE